MGEPEHIAALALHLCSDEAGYTTGQVVSPNGGLIHVERSKAGRTAGADPPLHRHRPQRAHAACDLDSRQPEGLDPPKRLDRAPVRGFHGPREPRPGRQHDGRDLEAPDRAAHSIVISVWLIVPSPGRAAITTGRPSSAAKSRTR